MSRWPRRAARLTALSVATLIAMTGAEAVLRCIDGYSLASLSLRRLDPRPVSTVAGGKLVDPEAAAEFIADRAVAPGVERAWFDLNPPAFADSVVDPDLRHRYAQHPGHELESVYEWNYAYVRQAVCSRASVDQAVFQHLDDVYVYDSPSDATRPPYRFLPSTTYPSGLHTNTFGWRGAEIDPAKPPTRLRVAFVGASTTIAGHSDPFSYPEYVGRWLQEWVHAHHPQLTVDVINAGREGVDSTTLAAIVEHELMPLGPDVVVYYEGANQFWPTNFVVNDVPLRLLRTMEAPAWLETHSALAARIFHVTRRASHDGTEAAKPPVWVRWPADLSEDDPPLDDARLPVQLPAILADLDRIRVRLATEGRVLILSSFVWLVHDGLALDPVRDAALFDYLNRSYWPFSYAHLRRYIDFENRVFRKYAASHRLPFIDVAAAFPRDPRLFVDGIHMTPAGVKLYAWLMFQQLVPHLSTAIAAGRLPQPGKTAAPRPHERRLVRVAEIRARCAQAQ